MQEGKQKKKAKQKKKDKDQSGPEDDTRTELLMHRFEVPEETYKIQDTSCMSWFFQTGWSCGGSLYSLFCIPFCGAGIQVQEGSQAAVLKFGKLDRIVGPGTYNINIGSEKFIIRSVRIQTLSIPSQQVMTRDNVSVSLDAVCFYKIDNLEKAIFNVADCESATKHLAQSTLETVLGERTLDEILTGRSHIVERVAELIDEQTEQWGIHVQALEIRDIRIPQNMQRVMAAVAEAEREGEAACVMAKAELRAAATYGKAADVMSKNPVSLQLRYFQILTEIAAERNQTIIIPSELTNMFRPLGNWQQSEAFAGNRFQREKQEKKK